MSLTVILPLPPDRANSRRHWAAQKKLQDAWALRATVDLQNSGKRPRKALARFTAHVTVCTKRKSDLDNCTSRIKPCLDLFTRLGWIVDDGPDQLVSLTVVNQPDWHRPRIEVCLTLA